MDPTKGKPYQHLFSRPRPIGTCHGSTSEISSSLAQTSGLPINLMHQGITEDVL